MPNDDNKETPLIPPSSITLLEFPEVDYFNRLWDTHLEADSRHMSEYHMAITAFAIGHKLAQTNSEKPNFWQPIETIPEEILRNGTFVLLKGGCTGDGEYGGLISNSRPVTASCVDINKNQYKQTKNIKWLVAEYDGASAVIEYLNPTHWAPIPE